MWSAVSEYLKAWRALRFSGPSMNRSFPNYTVAAVTILIAIATACGDRFAPPPLPEGAIPFGPPRVYETWWKDVEECSAFHAPFRRVRWFVVPGEESFVVNGQRDNGLWIEHYRFIILAEARLYDSLVVRHEMLHDLSGSLDHPAEYFQQRCVGVVQPFPT